MNCLRNLSLLLEICSLFFSACSTTERLRKDLPEPLPSNGLTNPRLVEGEFSIQIDSIRFLTPDSLRKWNEANSAGNILRPTFLLWCSDLVNYAGQRIIEIQNTGEQPNETSIEDENGNTILYWDLSGKMNENSTITIRRKFAYTTYDFAPRLDDAKPEADRAPDELVNRYTKSEPLLEQTPELVRLANKIVINQTSVLAKAKAIFSWVRDTMHYKYPPDARGILEVVKSYQGDCGQYSVLFVGLCRSIGIPSRQQSGFVVSDTSFDYHVWSEIYLPGIGWVPMDTTIPDGFGRLPNNRLISSVGMNIPLKHVPAWATYENQEAQCGRTDFMQFSTMVMSGFTARITSNRIVTKNELLDHEQQKGR